MEGLDQKENAGIGIVGMDDLLRLIRDKISLVDSRILLTGDTGTGKELIARYIHETSRRAREAFIAVNCGAIPEGLIESELFGHEKGSFTGAIRSRKGAFELADKGTLFLDEVADLTQLAQVKVLRALQEGMISSVGSEKNKEVDVRVIAATNRDLDAAIRKGNLREDLFYRLSVIQLKLLPLKERGDEEFGKLVRFFIKKYGAIKGNGTVVEDISAKAFSTLSSWSWSGNVRELENVIEHACVFCEGERIEEANLSAYLRRKSFVEDDGDKEKNLLSERRGPVNIHGLSDKLMKTLLCVGLKDNECNKLCDIAQSNKTLFIKLLSKMPKPKIKTLLDLIIREFLSYLKKKYKDNVTLTADRMRVSRRDMRFWFEEKVSLSESDFFNKDCVSLVAQIDDCSNVFDRLCTILPKWVYARRLLTGLVFNAIFEAFDKSKGKLAEEADVSIVGVEAWLRRIDELCDELQKLSGDR